MRYLVDRLYPKDSAVRFVSDHHRLPEAERFVLMRVVVPSGQARLRRAKLLPWQDLRGQEVLMDGYNVLITMESLLSGRPVYICDDGFLRDVQGIFRSYKQSVFTDPALTSIFDLLTEAGVARVEVLIDQQMSMSGGLAEKLRRMMAGRGLPGDARTARSADHELKITQATVATSDGNVIDAATSVVDLPARAASGLGIIPLHL